MEEEKLRKRVKKLAIIGLTLTFLFGGIAATVAHIFDNNYFAQRNKYDAITNGMDKKQVEEILGEGSQEAVNPSWAREGDYDDKYSYSLPILTATSGSWVEIRYKQGKVVSKGAYGGDKETFFLEKRPTSKLQGIWESSRACHNWLIQLAISGLLTYLSFVLAQHKDFITKEHKQTLGYFLLLGELGVVIYAGFMAFMLTVALLLAVPFYI